MPKIDKCDKIDFAKLLGFEVMRDQPSSFDFQDETFAARLGAKVGIEPGPSRDAPQD